jgi:hypothetical protein
MPPVKKRNRGPLSPRDKKVYGYLIWFLIAPAIFFLLYWLYTGGAGNRPPDRLSLPQKFYQAGETVLAGDRTLLAAPGGRITYSEELLVGSNRIVAEGGHTFTVIPLVIPEDSRDPDPSGWYLADGEGLKYNLLKVLPASPVQGSGPDPAAGRGKRLVYLVFKVRKDSGDTFLVTTSGKDQWAWKMPGPAGPGR